MTWWVLIKEESWLHSVKTTNVLMNNTTHNNNKKILCKQFMVIIHSNWSFRLRVVGFLAFCLLSHVLVYIMLNIICFRSALRILPDLACFRQLLCAIHILYQFCFQCSSRRFLKEFSVPANTMLGGKLFQFFYNSVSKKKRKKCILISKNCLLV